MRAIVVGAGVGGLAAAVGLTRSGWDVHVLERRINPGEIGAGISLWPNAITALNRLGVWPDIRTAAIAELGGVRKPDGTWLSRFDDGQRMPFEILLVHRGQLHDELMKALPHDVLRAGVEVTDVRLDGTVRHSHGIDRADLVVVADGLHSGVRARLWPDAPGPCYAGFTAWRGVTSEPFELDGGSGTWGLGSELGLVNMVDGRAYWYATANRPPGEYLDDEHAEVLRRFDGWHAPIGDVIRATPVAAVLRHDIYSLPTPLARFDRGRVVLLGDAAHAMLPNLGQGGCQALEDAVTLAAVMPRGDVEAGAARYDTLRRRRVQRFVRMSALAACVFQTENRAAAAARDIAAHVVSTRYVAAGLSRLFAWTPPAESG